MNVHTSHCPLGYELVYTFHNMKILFLPSLVVKIFVIDNVIDKIGKALVITCKAHLWANSATVFTTSVSWRGGKGEQARFWKNLHLQRTLV